MARHNMFRTAVGAAAIVVVIAGSTAASAGSEPPPPDGDVVETLTPDGQEVGNADESNPARGHQADGTGLTLTNDEVNPPIRAEDAPELAASLEGGIPLGDGYIDPALDVGGVDGFISPEQDG